MCLFLLQYNRNTRIVKQKIINVLKRNCVFCLICVSYFPERKRGF